MGTGGVSEVVTQLGKDSVRSAKLLKRLGCRDLYSASGDVAEFRVQRAWKRETRNAQMPGNDRCVTGQTLEERTAEA